MMSWNVDFSFRVEEIFPYLLISQDTKHVAGFDVDELQHLGRIFRNHVGECDCDGYLFLLTCCHIACSHMFW